MVLVYATSTRIRILYRILFDTNWPSVHTKSVNPVTKTVLFLDRSTDRFKVLFTRIRIFLKPYTNLLHESAFRNSHETSESAH